MGMFFDERYFGFGGDMPASNIEIFSAFFIIIITIALIGLIITVVYLVVKNNKNNEILNHRIDYLVNVISKNTSIDEIDRKHACISLLDEIIYCDPVKELHGRRVKFNLFISKANLVFLHDEQMKTLIELAKDQLKTLEEDIEDNYVRYTSSEKTHLISLFSSHHSEPYYKLLNYELNATLGDVREKLAMQLQIN